MDSSHPRRVKWPGPARAPWLKADHREVTTWFNEFEEAEKGFGKAEAGRPDLLAPTVHAAIEEEIFYPAAREGTVDADSRRGRVPWINGSRGRPAKTSASRCGKGEYFFLYHPGQFGFTGKGREA